MTNGNYTWPWHWGYKRERQGSYQTIECIALRLMIITAVPAITATFPPWIKRKWERGRKVKGLSKAFSPTLPYALCFYLFLASLSAKETGKHNILSGHVAATSINIESERSGFKSQLCHLSADVVKVVFTSLSLTFFICKMVTVIHILQAI